MSLNISSLVKFSATGILQWKTISANAVSLPGDMFVADTTNNSFTVALPTSPVTGAVVTFKDPSGSWTINPLLVDPGVEKLLGLTGVQPLSQIIGITLIYLGAIIGWQNFEIIGAAGSSILAATTPALARTTLGLGSMAVQSASAVALTGGTVDGTPIGSTAASTGTFTLLTATTPAVTDLSQSVATTAYSVALLRGNWRTLTATYAISPTDYPSNFYADTTAGGFTITLPLAPLDGATILIVDPSASWATNNLTINPNGANIAGSSANLICDVNNYNLRVQFKATSGWKVSGVISQ